jgi:transposase
MLNGRELPSYCRESREIPDARGRTTACLCTVASGLRSGAHWSDLPERYGRWKTVHRRFSRWCHAGVWERVFAALTEDRDNRYLMIDSTIVRAHQQAASGKGGPKIRRWGVPEAD